MQPKNKPKLVDLLELRNTLIDLGDYTGNLYDRIQRKYIDIFVRKLGVLSLSLTLIIKEGDNNPIMHSLFENPQKSLIIPVFNARNYSEKKLDDDDYKYIRSIRGDIPEFHNVLGSAESYEDVTNSNVKFGKYYYLVKDEAFRANSSVDKYAIPKLENNVFRRYIAPRNDQQVDYFAVLLWNSKLEIDKELVEFFAYSQGSWLRRKFDFDFVLPFLDILWAYGMHSVLEKEEGFRIKNALADKWRDAAEKYEIVAPKMEGIITDLKRVSFVAQKLQLAISPMTEQILKVGEIGKIKNIFQSDTVIGIDGDVKIRGLHSLTNDLPIGWLRQAMIHICTLINPKKMQDCNCEECPVVIKALKQYINILEQNDDAENRRRAFNLLKILFLKAQDSRKIYFALLIIIVLLELKEASEEIEIIFNSGEDRYTLHSKSIEINGSFIKQLCSLGTGTNSLIRADTNIGLSGIMRAGCHYSCGVVCKTIAQLITDEFPLYNKENNEMYANKLVIENKNDYIGISLYGFNKLRENEWLTNREGKWELRGLRSKLAILENAIGRYTSFEELKEESVISEYFNRICFYQWKDENRMDRFCFRIIFNKS